MEIFLNYWNDFQWLELEFFYLRFQNLGKDHPTAYSVIGFAEVLGDPEASVSTIAEYIKSESTKEAMEEEVSENFSVDIPGQRRQSFFFIYPKPNARKLKIYLRKMPICLRKMIVN